MTRPSREIRIHSSWRWLEGWPAIFIGVIVVCATASTAIWRFTYARIEQEKQLVIENASFNSANVARILSENLARVLDKTKIYGQMAARNQGAGGRKRLAEQLRLVDDHTLLHLAYYDARGHELFSSPPDHLPVTLDGGMIRRLRHPNGDQHDMPVVGVPGGGQESWSWSLPVYAAVRGNDERIEGFVLAEYDLGYFQQFYRNVDLGKNAEIGIIGQDGVIRMASAGNLVQYGVDVRKSELFARIAANADGSDSVRGPLDATLRSYSWYRVAGYPLVVSVGRSHADLLQSFSVRKSRYFLSAWFLALLIAGLGLGIIALARRQHRVHLRLQEAQQEKQTLINALEEEKQHAFSLASCDHLTGLPNRMRFSEVAARKLAQAVRKEQSLALMFIDLDRFKAVNDTLGHKVGDLLLEEVGRRLRACVRETDVVSRFGGDEFLILLGDAANPDAVARVAKKVIQSVSEPVAGIDPVLFKISASVGISLFPQDGPDVDALIRNADLAMYQAKEDGKGVYRFWQAAFNEAAALNVELESHMAQAIANGEFVLHYQPRVEVATSRVTSMEALIRWNHPSHGLLYPGKFIPIAEDTGLIIPLGNWVIEEACRQIAQWLSMGLLAVPVAVNVSALQLNDPGLLDTIRNALNRFQVPPELFEVEVTESCMPERDEAAGMMLAELKNIGVAISIDDFGTGYSNLGRLRMLPVDCVKIDSSFIRDIQNNSDDSSLTSSVIALCHRLGLKVVAEGVETRDQLIYLKLAHCDEVQGYYFSRPVPAGQAETLVRQRLIAAEASI